MKLNENSMIAHWKLNNNFQFTMKIADSISDKFIISKNKKLDI